IQLKVFNGIFLHLAHIVQLHLLSEMLDRRVHKNPSYPALKRPFASKLLQVLKNFNKTFLQQVIGIFNITGITQANAVHFWRKSLIKYLLHLPVSVNTS